MEWFIIDDKVTTRVFRYLTEKWEAAPDKCSRDENWNINISVNLIKELNFVKVYQSSTSWYLSGIYSLSTNLPFYHFLWISSDLFEIKILYIYIKFNNIDVFNK